MERAWATVTPMMIVLAICNAIVGKSLLYERDACFCVNFSYVAHFCCLYGSPSFPFYFPIRSPGLDSSPVPGCSGTGTPGIDYCFESSPEMLRLRNFSCSDENPCSACEGVSST